MIQDLALEFPTLHPAQQIIHDSPARFRVAVCGVRFRKSSLGVLECTETYLRGGAAWYVVPNYPLSIPPWRFLSGIAQQIQKAIPGIEILQGDRTIRAPGGGFVALKSAASREGLRAEGLDLCVVDEAAFIVGGEDIWESQLRGRLMDRQGRGLFITSPNGRNWIEKRYNFGQGNDPDWESWRFTSWDNPSNPDSERVALERAVREGRFSSTRYKQEYLAEFVEFEGQVFRFISNAARADALEEARGNNSYIIGVDWARTTDATVLAVLELDTKQFVCIDRFVGTDYETQKTRLRALAKKFRATRIICESNSMGGPLIEELRRTLPVEAFLTTNATKATAVEALQLAFESFEVAIPPDPIVLSEFEMYTREDSPSGAPRYSAPEGCHDDIVMACVIAWSGYSGGLQCYII